MTLTLKNVRREWTSPQAETQYNRLQEIIDNESRILRAQGDPTA
jgi:hypothetical protein